MLTREEACRHGEDGISIVELVVVMGLLMVVGSIFVSGLVGGFRASSLVQARMEAMSDLQVSVQRMTRDIRAAAPVQRVTVGTNQSVHVRVFKPGRCDRVTYRVEGSELAQYTQPLTPVPASDGEPLNLSACANPSPPDLAATGPPPGTRRVLVRDLAAGTQFTYRRTGGALLDFSAAPRPQEGDIGTVQVTVRRHVRRGGVVEVDTTVLLRNQR